MSRMPDEVAYELSCSYHTAVRHAARTEDSLVFMALLILSRSAEENMVSRLP